MYLTTQFRYRLGMCLLILQQFQFATCMIKNDAQQCNINTCPLSDNELIKKAFSQKGSTKMFPPKEIHEQFKNILHAINRTDAGQIAVIAVIQFNKIVYQNTSKIGDLRKRKEKPLPKPGHQVDENTNKTNVRHTEQDLFLRVDKSLENCSKERHCDIFLYTKFSPCRKHPQSYAESCMVYIVTTCRDWFEKKRIRCHVGFDSFYHEGKEIFKSDKWAPFFQNVIGSHKHTNKFKITKNLTESGYSNESLMYADGSIKENIEKIHENLEIKLKTEVYSKVAKNIVTKNTSDTFLDKYNTMQHYLKQKGYNTTLLKKTLQEVFNDTKGFTKTNIGNMINRFEQVVDDTNEVFIRDMLNTIVTKWSVEKYIEDVVGDVHFFHLYHLEH